MVKILRFMVEFDVYAFVAGVHAFMVDVYELMADV